MRNTKTEANMAIMAKRLFRAQLVQGPGVRSDGICHGRLCFRQSLNIEAELLQPLTSFRVAGPLHHGPQVSPRQNVKELVPAIVGASAGPKPAGYVASAAIFTRNDFLEPQLCILYVLNIYIYIYTKYISYV